MRPLKLLTQLFGGRASVANATRLLVHLRRQPADHPWSSNKYGRGPAWSQLFEDNARFGLGMRLAADLHRREAPTGRHEGRARERVRRSPPEPSAEVRVRPLADAREGRRAESAVGRHRQRPGPRPAFGRRPPATPLGVDRRRRRLGVRHRVGWTRPRAGVRPQRERAGARHGGVLEHRRAGVQGDADGRGRQVRGRRQGDHQQGPCAPGHRLRQRVRSPGRDGCRPAADAEGVPRGGGL